MTDTPDDTAAPAAPAPPAPPKPAANKTVLELVTLTTQLFAKNGVASPRLEAELLLTHVLGVERIQLYVRFDQPLGEAEVAAYRELVKRRGRHEPVHYILGRREFWSLDLAVEKGVLIPRPDTECLVEEVLAYLRARPALVADAAAGAGPWLADVCTGSGAIAVALASEVPRLTVWAGDLMPIPVRVAADNVRRHHLGERVHVVAADLLAPLAAAAGRRFDIVTANPPYLSEARYRDAEAHVREEPREALLGGADGLDVVRALVGQLAQGLAIGGALFIEIDHTQGPAVCALLAGRFDEVPPVRKDYGGDDRVVRAFGFRG